MGRCPKFLDVNGFDKLAHSMKVELTDDGVSALGEISEYIAQQILEIAQQNMFEEAQKTGQLRAIDIAAIVSSAEKITIALDVDWHSKTVKSARL